MHLKRLYCRYNRRYFDGRLPTDIKVEWSSKLPPLFGGGTHVHGMLDCYWGGKNCNGHFIRIRPCLKKWSSVAHITLLHEMVHMLAAVTGNPRYLDHGYLWQREMKRLANSGAFNRYW